MQWAGARGLGSHGARGRSRDRTEACCAVGRRCGCRRTPQARYTACMRPLEGGGRGAGPGGSARTAEQVGEGMLGGLVGCDSTLAT
eukprot:303151-Chlamydomonas_euryale.AAC.1